MGQQSTNAATQINNSLNLSGTLGTKVAPAGYLGTFGNGLFQPFGVSGTFTVPTGITSIRVRVVGAGGGGFASGTGGGGGGYAHGVFTVIPGATYTVTIGIGGTAGASATAGGTTSFGALISATGGQAGKAGATPATGGTGTGGDFQATGGASGGAAGSGGGGAGSSGSYANGNPATVNTGGGGGGTSGTETLYSGGAGGRGIVILRWLTAQGSITVGAGLTADSTGTDGSYSYKRFTDGSGNVSFA